MTKKEAWICKTASDLVKEKKMNINRNNYETYFLLYVDNELPATQRKAVEDFVRANADLEWELQCLMETSLPADHISFNGKPGLYKEEIIFDDLQEKLLMHLDHELDETESSAIQAKIDSSKNLGKEWEIWQQTKLDATEQVVFNDKQSLYRNERARVVPMRLYRAAAAILLVGLFTGIVLLRKDKPAENEIARTGTDQDVKGKTGNTDNNNVIAGVTKPGMRTTPGLTQPVSQDGTVAGMKEKNNTLTNAGNANRYQSVGNDIASGKRGNNERIETNLPDNALENINNPESNESNTLPVINNRKSDVVYVNKSPDEVNGVPKENVTTPSTQVMDYNSIPSKQDEYARTAVLDEASQGSDNKILYMNEDKVSRSKVGGIFRRVKRVVERNTNIKTGNGVKIAGFEFALK